MCTRSDNKILFAGSVGCKSTASSWRCRQVPGAPTQLPMSEGPRHNIPQGIIVTNIRTHTHTPKQVRHTTTHTPNTHPTHAQLRTRHTIPWRYLTILTLAAAAVAVARLVALEVWMSTIRTTITALITPLVMRSWKPRRILSTCAILLGTISSKHLFGRSFVYGAP
jgi:hypothetical protein